MDTINFLETTGLVSDVWWLILKDTGIMERHTLIFTCKALYNLLTSAWSAALTRYLLLHNHRREPMPSDYQDQISRQVTANEIDINYNITSRSSGIYIQLVEDYGSFVMPALFVVNTYQTLQDAYKLLKTGSRVSIDSNATSLIRDVIVVRRDEIIHRFATRLHAQLRDGRRVARYFIRLKRDAATLKDYAESILKIVNVYFPEVTYVILGTNQIRFMDNLPYIRKLWRDTN